MMSVEEGWIMHGLEAIEQIIKDEIVWKQFVKAIRGMKLDSTNMIDLGIETELQLQSS